MTGTHPLDDAVLGSLTGAHAHLAEVRGAVRRYPPDVSVWTGMPSLPGPQDWRDAAELIGPEREMWLMGQSFPHDWDVVRRIEAVELVDGGVVAADEPDAVVLGPPDVPEMLSLVGRTNPGPFATRTVELGTYLGIRREGRLVAMAGQRLHPPGWVELSAVCTDPAYRGQGLGTRLTRAVVADVRRRGEQACLHATVSNTVALRLYESLGFRLRRELAITGARPPSG